MKKLIFFFIMLFSIISFSQEKRNCGTNYRLEKYQTKYPESILTLRNQELQIQKWIKQNANSKTSAITIPVVVHIVHKNNTENISDAQIQSQIDVLNEDFRRLNQDASNTPFDFLPFVADMQIEFCLAYLSDPVLFRNRFS